jgi:apolipoprotein D and lipocalin family protein
MMNKKLVAATTLMLFAALLVKAEKKSRRPLRIVPSVDLARYEGLWYEIARLPNRFEDKCAGDVTARYDRLGDDRLKVVNRCRKRDGTVTKAEGVARIADRRGPNSRLKVRFAPGFLSFLPWVWGDYQIIELAPDYSYTLVGERGRGYLWVLSRTPQMDEGTYRGLTESAAAQGFDVSRLVRTKQG